MGDVICGDCGDDADEFLQCCFIWLCEDCAERHRARYSTGSEDHRPADEEVPL